MSERKSRTTSDSMEETKRHHELWFNAIGNPLRRRILRALKDGDASIEDLESKTGLDRDTLTWHLDFLERGLCIEKSTIQDRLIYKLTKEGKVVDYMG